MSKVAQSPDELKAQLKEKLTSLELAATAFDDGHTGEAKTMATAVRVLVHSKGGQSQSLLSQLDLQATYFVDSTSPYVPGNQLPYIGLCAFDSQRGHYAPLDGSCGEKRVPFEAWWAQKVFEPPVGGVSRKKLVLSLSDQDGGAHVDAKLDATYAALSRGNALQITQQSAAGRESIRHIERTAMRQIAHEVLRTLKPGYTKEQPRSEAPFVILGASMTGQVLREGPPGPQPVVFGMSDTPARFGACPCGSGQRFTDCHGKL